MDLLGGAPDGVEVLLDLLNQLDVEVEVRAWTVHYAPSYVEVHVLEAHEWMHHVPVIGVVVVESVPLPLGAGCLVLVGET